MSDHFIYANPADRRRADWIKDALEDEGHTTVTLLWPPASPTDWVHEILRAAEGTEDTVLVVSDSFTQHELRHPEWIALLQGADEQVRTIIPVRIDTCQPMWPLGSMRFVDVGGSDDTQARSVLQAPLADVDAGPDPLNVAATLECLADAYSTGRFDDVEPWFRRTLADVEPILRRYDDPKLNAICDELDRPDGEEKYAEASRLYAQSTRLREKMQGANHPDVAKALQASAELHYLRCSFAIAEPLFQRALGIFETALGADHDEVIATLTLLAKQYRDQRRDDDADRVHARVTMIAERMLKRDDLGAAEKLDQLGRFCHVLKRYEDGSKWYRRALAIREAAHGSDHVDVADTLVELGRHCGRLSGDVDAEEHFQRALHIYERALTPGDFKIVRCLNSYQMMLASRGRVAELEAVQARLASIRPRNEPVSMTGA